MRVEVTLVWEDLSRDVKNLFLAVSNSPGGVKEELASGSAEVMVVFALLRDFSAKTKEGLLELLFTKGR